MEQPKVVQILTAKKETAHEGHGSQMMTARKSRITNVSYNAGQILRPDSSPQ